MKLDVEPETRRFVSVPTLTAWLSLCILAAAWGRSLDDQWQPVWASMGAYGLVASVGLSVMEKARRAHQKRLQDRNVRSRVECGLEKLNEHGATLDSISAAVRKLNSFATHHPQARPVSAQHRKRGARAQTLAQLPLEIAPVVDHSETECELAEPISGSIEEITSQGVSFFHSVPFIAKVAMLTFQLGERHRLSFVVDVLWTEASPEGFVSGGSVLAVGVPPDAQEAAGEYLETSQACPA